MQGRCSRTTIRMTLCEWAAYFPCCHPPLDPSPTNSLFHIFTAQDRKIHDAQAEKLTILQAYKLTRPQTAYFPCCHPPLDLPPTNSLFHIFTAETTAMVKFTEQLNGKWFWHRWTITIDSIWMFFEGSTIVANSTNFPFHIFTATCSSRYMASY